MIRNSVLVTRTYYYPLGNTPAVSLTQDLPPEQDADILLLGCGDARNILFTCYVDTARKIDVTCCDIEPGIHARNVLLYSLLIEDRENINIESIWNIYYHWKLDKNSAELLDTQSQKLLEVSKSIDQWHGSVYGSWCRFCDERSLSLVRSYWMGFRLRGQKKHRQSELQAAYDRAKALRQEMLGKSVLILSDLRSTCPVFDTEIPKDLSKISKQWWELGTTFSDTKSAKSLELNPAFLYSRNQTLTLHYGLSPLVGFPLSTSYTKIAKSLNNASKKCVLSAEALVDSAKNHFKLWAAAFRRAVANKSVIRMFCGDALAFGLTLRHCGLAIREYATSMNLFCDNWSNSPLKLYDAEYGNGKNAAPLRFDVIDTSNLVDHLGPLNIIGIGSSLLKHNSFSCLYTEMLVQRDLSVTDRLSGFFGVDIHSMSSLFGLVLPDLFTNATDSFDADLMVNKMSKLAGGAQNPITQVRSRLRWKRLRGCQESSTCRYLQVEAKELAKLLIQVHDVMFEYEDPTSMLSSLSLNDPSVLSKQVNLCYNRLSFALLLNLLRATVITDWDQCIQDICQSCWRLDSICSIKTNCRQDLTLQMRLCGLVMFLGPTLADVNSAVLAPLLPFCTNEEVPEQLCITIRISKEKLKAFTKDADQTGTPAITCTFEGKDPGGKHWLDIFSAVQVMFGAWQYKEDNSHPFIKEDSSQLFGTADMFVSVYVPTSMLLQSKHSVPQVRCGLIRTATNFLKFSRVLGPCLYFSCNEMTDKDVFISQFMPGMSSLPIFALVSAQQNKPVSSSTTMRLTQDGSKIATLIQHTPVKCPKAKAKLAIQSSVVKLEFKSPLIAVVSIANSEELKFEFPVPVSPLKYRVRIARKSSYIEIESPLFDPLEDDASFFMFPTFIIKVPGGATTPMLWTSTRIDLDAMPPIDFTDTREVPWLMPHVFNMFSERERSFREANALRKTKVDVRTCLKDSIFAIITSYTGLEGRQAKFFALSKTAGGNQTLIFPACIRLDLINHTVVLDAAIIPVTSKFANDPRTAQFLRELAVCGFGQSDVTEDENRAWKVAMPALVERCRTAETWKHKSDCEYIQAGEVPLSKGLNEDGVSPICSCGIGQFPSGYHLKNQIEKVPNLGIMLNQYATRVAISPVFVVSYVKNSYPMEKCVKCGRSKEDDVPARDCRLMACSRCKIVKYCSKECQKADWKNHKSSCSAA